MNYEIDSENIRLTDRVNKLEKAIVDANSWLKADEGIDLLYHYSDLYEEGDSVELIKSVLSKSIGA